jgi:hypothetical protein
MNFWKRLCGRGCAHRFSWPRIDANGCHYQVCLLCGTAYEYDWAMMRRTRRLMARFNAVNVPVISSNRQQFPASPPDTPITPAARAVRSRSGI